MRIFLLFFLFIFPVILGTPWACALFGNSNRRMMAILPLGYFLELAVFQFLAFPFALLKLSFTALCICFISVLLVCAVLSIKKAFSGLQALRIGSFSFWDWFYLLIFLVLFGYQVYHALTMDRTYMSHDDAYYVVVANDALIQNTLFVHEAFTGIGKMLDVHRSMQASLVFPAFLSFVSGISAVTMEHTMLDVYYLLLSYSVYAFLGCILFKKKEDIFIFLIILSVVYIFGNYSLYSPSMRLLGLNYPGKALLAICFLPFLFSLLLIYLNQPYNIVAGFLLFLLSAAATSLTLFGTVTMMITVSVPIFLSLFRKKRERKHLRYIAWSGILPVIYAGIFFANKLLV